ncbi:MAG TPA: M57 family metalloprotease [Kofleriaceae bacterium]|nr:M57 family metalloprotease [Kofleriaceae bacterium]
MKATLLAASCGVLAFGCNADLQDEGAGEIQEIVDNLVEAGFPSDDIQIFDGKVYTGRDALVTLQASREMLQRGEGTSGGTKEQYRTSNLVSSSVRKICVNPTSSFSSNGTLMTGLADAVANYNALPLRFDFAVGPTTGCDANISITTQGGTGSSAGFPSGGLPYAGPVYIGTDTPSSGPTKHVIEHELGHCIGFRHSDYYDRSISCGGSAVNEGSAGVGAILISDTPSTATYNGSVFNSCYNSGSTGTFASSDVTALGNTYPLRSDQVSAVKPGEGSWGDWRNRAYCSEGSWAVGYRMRVESNQSGGDDTALNSVQLLCKNPSTGATEWVSSYDGLWGSWNGSASCASSGQYLKGAQMRIESNQGGW